MDCNRRALVCLIEQNRERSQNHVFMMTSSNGNIFHGTDPLWAKSTGDRWIPLPHKSQWRGALMFCLIGAWTNNADNNRDAGDLRRHRAHYDVIVTCVCLFELDFPKPKFGFVNPWNPHQRWIHWIQYGGQRGTIVHGNFTQFIFQFIVRDLITKSYRKLYNLDKFGILIKYILIKEIHSRISVWNADPDFAFMYMESVSE